MELGRRGAKVIVNYANSTEAAEEVVAALRSKDAARFQRLLLTPQEIGKLGLNKELTDKLNKRVSEAAKTFVKLALRGRVENHVNINIRTLIGRISFILIMIITFCYRKESLYA